MISLLAGFYSGWVILQSHQQHMSVSLSPHSQQQLLCLLFDNNHSNKCKVISHCDLYLYFPDNYWCWTSFHAPIGHVYVFFGKNIYSYPLPIFKSDLFWLFSCRGSSYILDTDPLSVYGLQIHSPIQDIAFSFSWFPLLCRTF